MVNKTSSRKKNVENNSSTNLQPSDKLPELLEHDYTYYLSSSQDSLSIPVKEKFARLKYGNNQELIFNLNCQIKFLIDYFFLKLNHAVQVESLKMDLDVTDVDGSLKYLKGNDSKLASEFLNPRELYILVDSRQCDQNGSLLTTPLQSINNNYNNIYFRITPLLINNVDLLTPTYLSTINSRAFKSNKKSFNPSFSTSTSTSTNKSNKHPTNTNNLTLIKEFDESNKTADASKNLSHQTNNNIKKTSRHN